MQPQWSGGTIARVALLVPFVLPSCLARPATSQMEPPSVTVPHGEQDRAVVLVAIDGARWQEIFFGVDRARAKEEELGEVDPIGADELTPNLHRLARERGVMLGAPGMGAPVVASGPNYVSMPGYTEMFTGRTPLRCQDNACPPPSAPTIFDEVRRVSDRATDVAVIASWEGIGRVAAAEPSAMVLSTGRRSGVNREKIALDARARALLEDAERAAPEPGAADFRPDRFTSRLALAYLEAARPRILFVGLGETDEYAHQGDYRGYLGALRAADALVGEVDAALARMGERGRRTTVIVTADHGRARGFRDHGDWAPESGRVWMVAIGGRGIGRGVTSRPEVTRLADVAPTVRALLCVPRLEGGSGDEGSVIREIVGL